MDAPSLIRGAVGALLLACAWPGGLYAQITPRNHAIVIGIDEYPSVGDVRPLSYAEADAKAMERILKASNYLVTPLIAGNARRANILRELQRLAANANEQDSVLIYFAGHGVRRKLPRSNQSYWLTYDATMGLLEVDGIRVSHLIDYVNEIPARRKILILDHCHSGEIAPVAGTSGRGESAGFRKVFSFEKDNFRAEVAARKPDALVVFAAAINEAFELPSLRQGLFTHLLIRALEGREADKDNDGKVTVNELSEYIDAKFKAEAAKHNVVQDWLHLVDGANPNWVLFEDFSSSGDLELLVATLYAERRLSVDAYARFSTAIADWNDARRKGAAPNPLHAQYVETLRQVRDVRGVDSGTRASMLENFFKATKTPGSR